MSIKLKALGLGLLAVLAMGAIAVMNASAETSGHFVAEPPEDHLILKGTESRKSGTHALSFYEINPLNTKTVENAVPIQCTHVDYHGTLEASAATTNTAVRLRPNYTECSTKAEAPHNVTVHVPTACGTNVFEFTPGGNGTVHVNCTITITHPNCGITIPPQTVAGVTYNTIEDGGKHALTAVVNVSHIKGEFHENLCVFLGTTHWFEMVGSVTVWGENTAGGRVNITHTAP